VLAVLLGTVACATLQQLAALREVAFSLAGVRNARLAGIDLSRVTSYRDLSVVDVGRIALALSRGDLPLEFQVDVRAENPIENGTVATMTRLAWALYLDDKETINGTVDSTISIPPGPPVVIPLRMRLNVREFFDGPAQNLVDLAASFVGRSADPTKVSLRAVPTITTPIGAITYPSPITILNRTVGAPGAP
jgi:hypothetical protein